MKRAALVVALMAMACAAKDYDGQREPAYPAMSLIGRYGYGHACPLPRGILTAAHVAYGVSRDGRPTPLFYAYQQGARHGFLSPLFALQSRDLAILKLDLGDEPEANEPALVFPRPGDEVSWFEYDFQRNAYALRATRRKAKVVRTMSGHMVFAPAPVQGASGSCIFDAEDRVVGIVAWGMATMDGEKVGVGPVIVGDWDPF